ncbi:hypothetical protein AAMO2058_000540200 [Amorphochlora amoebiformis]
MSAASDIALEGVLTLEKRLRGVGLDWGTGIGHLALACAQSDKVDKVYGFDINQENIECAKVNAVCNGLSHKTQFIAADSYSPLDPKYNNLFSTLKLDFIVSNPPASDLETSDGFDFRRRAETC